MKVQSLTAMSIATLLIATSQIAAGAPAEEWMSKLSPNLQADLQVPSSASGLTRHRVIVNLAQGPYATSGAMRQALTAPAEATAYRDFVGGVQNAFRASIALDSAQQVIRQYRNIPSVSMRLTADQIEKISAHPLVRSVERMEVYQKYDNEAHPLTGVDLAQAGGFTGSGVTVAVIDDGIQSDHPAFGAQTGFPTSKILGGFDFGDNDADPRNDCAGQSHGTSVTGIIAGNGSGGVTGVARDASLVFLKIQSASICGSSSLDGDLVGAIDWVVTNQSTYNISVLSMSLGGGEYTSVSSCQSSNGALRNALDAAEAAGIATFAASGNNGFCQSMGSPACIGSAISVGATYDANIGNVGFCISNSSCVSTSFNPACSFGTGAAFEGSTFADKVTVYSNSASFLDLLAPSNCANTSSTNSGTNTCFGGTSAATPFAAGTAALAIEAAGGSLSPSAILSALQSNGVNVTDPRNGRVTPRVDAYATVQSLSGGPTPEICDNNIDDDGDGDTDCADSDCTSDPVCAPGGSETVFEASGSLARDEWDDYGPFSVVSGTQFVAFMDRLRRNPNLYVRWSSPPTNGSWDCRPALSGSPGDETCDLTVPGGVTQAYVSIRGRNRRGDNRYDLTVTYTAP